MFCNVKSCEGADGTTADDGDALGRGGGHSVDGGRTGHSSGTEIPEILKSAVQIFSCGNFLKTVDGHEFVVGID